MTARRLATTLGALALGAATIGGVATIGLTQARAQAGGAPPAGMSGPAAGPGTTAAPPQGTPQGTPPGTPPAGMGTGPGMNGAMERGAGTPPPPPPHTGAYEPKQPPAHRQTTRYRATDRSQNAEVERLNSESLDAARKNQAFVPQSNR